MWFVLSHYWIAAVIALGLGVLVGFITWGRHAEPKGLNRWLMPMMIGVIIALILIVFKVLPGRSGVWLESALMLFGLYIGGCFVGGWLKSLMAVPASVQVQNVQAPITQPPAVQAPSATQASSAPVAAEHVAVVDVAPIKEITPPAEAPKPADPLPVASTSPEPKAKATPKPKAKPEVKVEPKTEVKAETFELIEAIEGEDDHAGKRPVGYKAPKNGLGDDLKIIKGIAKVNEARLHALGIWHFEQIANWTTDEILWVGSYLAFPGRIQREKWVEQSKEIIAKRVGN